MRWQEGADRELRFFEIQRDLAAAIREAALARGPSGKRLSHQRRIPGRVLEKARKILASAEPSIARAKTFAELHDIIESSIRPLPGVGELMVYDTALRIGAKLGLSPDDVYVHAGTRVGARALGFRGSRKTISPAELPRPLRALRPREIEDVLCIYKSQLTRLLAHGG
jgi:hypothetical protein